MTTSRFPSKGLRSGGSGCSFQKLARRLLLLGCLPLLILGALTVEAKGLPGGVEELLSGLLKTKGTVSFDSRKIKGDLRRSGRRWWTFARLREDGSLLSVAIMTRPGSSSTNRALTDGCLVRAVHVGLASLLATRDLGLDGASDAERREFSNFLVQDALEATVSGLLFQRRVFDANGAAALVAFRADAVSWERGSLLTAERKARFWDYLLVRARSEVRAKNYRGALGLYRGLSSFTLTRERFELWGEVAWVSALAGDREHSRAILERLAPRGTVPVEEILYRAQASLLIGQENRAYRWLELGLERHPENHEILELYSNLPWERIGE